MRLAASYVRHAQGRQSCQIDGRAIKIKRGGEDGVIVVGAVAIRCRGLEHMEMLRHFALCQRMARLAAPLALYGEAAAYVNRHTASQVGKGKGCLPVAAIHRAQQREERLILVDGKQLPIAKRPPLWRKVPTDYLDFTHKWLRHSFLLPGVTAYCQSPGLPEIVE